MLGLAIHPTELVIICSIVAVGAWVAYRIIAWAKRVERR